MRGRYRKLKTGLLVLVSVILAFLVWGRYHTASVKLETNAFEGYLLRTAERAPFAAESRQPCADSNPLRNPYFGDLHVHTALSGDASAFGATVTPEEAYRFAQGESLAVSLRSDAPNSAPEIKLARPLDFAAITDHAEYLGEAHLCLTPGSTSYDTLLCGLYRRDVRPPIPDVLRPLLSLASFTLFKTRSQSVCGDDGFDCLKAASTVWQGHQRAAEDAYDRSTDCSFTSFVAYEYSLAREQANLHRNVIFANAAVPPSPLSSREAGTPEELWQWLQQTCRDTESGCDAMTIPHNSNWSNGRMFYPYSLSNRSPEKKREMAALRHELEPLVEIMQVKGDSECRNGLSRVFGAPDEFCDFEKLRLPDEIAADCEDDFGSGGMSLNGCLSRYSYARYGIFEGLREERLMGSNSLKLGIVAATDTHIGAAGAVDEATFPGSVGHDRTAKGRLRERVEVPLVAKADPMRFGPGGLAGVWAEENTRESLFASMQRRETFGTSGPRIVPRFFAGWNYDPRLCEAVDMLPAAYAGGVPMGGDLPGSKNVDARPTLLFSALMDNLPEATPLQKIQIIKGWIDDGGNMNQSVIDVAGDSFPTIEVDPATCEPKGSGHRRLCGVWQDRDFDPTQSTVYYARVVENPSCRWTTHDCNSLPANERPEVCDISSIPKVIQERAWTSPIWYRAQR